MPGHWGGSSSTGSHSKSYNPGAGGVVQHSAPKAKTKAKHSPHGGGPGTGYVPPKKKTTTVTTGGQSPFAYTKPPITKGRINTAGGITGIKNRNILNWLKNKAGKYTGYTQHNINNQLLKNALTSGQITENQYKRMGGYDVAQQFPGPKIIDVPIVGAGTTLYNAFVKAPLNIADPSDVYSQYEKYGPEQSIDLNIRGATGLNPSNLQRYESIVGGHQEVGGMLPGGHLPGINKEPPKEIGERIYDWTHKAADGGLINFYRYGGFI